MAQGIAGDSPQTIPTATLTTAQTLDLLTQLLIELRANTVILSESSGFKGDIANIRSDQDRAVVTGVDY